MTDITELAQSLKAAAIDAKELAIITRYSKGRSAAEKFYALANPANAIALVDALENEIAMRQQNLDIKLNLRQQIVDLELKHRQRDRDDFIRAITHPASMYTADEAMEAIAEYDRTH